MPSGKNCLAGLYQEALGRLDFSDNQNFKNLKVLYSNIIQNTKRATDLVALFKWRSIKQNSQEYRGSKWLW